jgi:hypothetical protein
MPPFCRFFAEKLSLCDSDIPRFLCYTFLILCLPQGTFMPQPGKIVILGASLFMQMIADGLTQILDTEITRLSPYAPDALAQMMRLSPDIVIVEHTPSLDATNSSLVLELLYTCPGLRLVGLDTSQPATLLLSSTRLSTNSVQELVKVLDTYHQVET